MMMLWCTGAEEHGFLPWLGDLQAAGTGSEVEHSVEDADSDAGFGFLRWPVVRAQSVALMRWTPPRFRRGSAI